MSSSFSLDPDTKARMAMLANLLAKHESRSSDDRLASITTITDRPTRVADSLQMASDAPGNST